MSASSSLLSPALDFPLLWICCAYLLGSLPFAVWIGRSIGKDPRRQGSKNPGASNVARTAGIRWGLITLILDALKGAVIPFLIMRGHLVSAPDPRLVESQLWNLELTEWAALCGMSAVLGHVFSIFLRFKGGRGVATALGAMAILHLNIAAFSASAWIITLLLTRVPAWSSLVLCASLIVLSNAQGVPDSVHLFCLCVAGLITVRHWSHLRRLFEHSPTTKRSDYLALYPSFSRRKSGESKSSKKKNRRKASKQNRGNHHNRGQH